MDTLLSDIRFAFRMIKKRKGQSFLAVFALALGIASVTAQFSIVKGVIYNGLPFPNSEKIYHMEWAESESRHDRIEFNVHEFYDIREQQTSFDGISGFYSGTANFKYKDLPNRYSGAFISTNFLNVLEMNPIRGVRFDPDDDKAGKEPVIMIGYEMWEKEFGFSEDTVGTLVSINGTPRRIIGIMEENFRFPLENDLWIPLPLNPLEIPRGGDSMTLEVFGRLKDGVNIDQAHQDLIMIAKRLEVDYPNTNKGYNRFDIKPYVEEYIGPTISTTMHVLLVFAFFVLVLSCGNVANLLLARVAKRGKEMAIRGALGAKQGDIIRQILTESLIISFTGAIAGIGLAFLAIKMLWEMVVPLGVPFWIHFEIDTTVLIFTVFIAVVSAIISGLVPAINSARTNINKMLKDDTRTSTSKGLNIFSGMLVVTQITLSLGLLIPAMFMMDQSSQAQKVEFPWDGNTIMTARIGTFENDYPDPIDRINFFNEYLIKLKNNPSINYAALTTAYTYFNIGQRHVVLPDDNTSEMNEIPMERNTIVSDEYFQVANIALLTGRYFEPEDRDGRRIVIINKSFSEKYFPGESPIGKRFSNEGTPSDKDWLEIVGVVADAHMQGINNTEDDEAGFYMCYSQEGNRFMTIMVNGSKDLSELTNIMRKEMANVDPGIPLYEVASLEQLRQNRIRGNSVFSTMFMAFGIIGLLLAAIGIYGVVSFSVNQRVPEFGVRIALGASRSRIYKLIFWKNTIQLITGTVLGALIAFGFSMALGNEFNGLNPFEAKNYILVTAIMMIIAFIAILIPSTKAGNTDPMVTLQAE